METLWELVPRVLLATAYVLTSGAECLQQQHPRRIGSRHRDPRPLIRHLFGYIVDRADDRAIEPNAEDQALARLGLSRLCASHVSPVEFFECLHQGSGTRLGLRGPQFWVALH